MVPLYTSPKLSGVTQTIFPIIFKLKLNEKLKLTLEILLLPVFLTLTENEYLLIPGVASIIVPVIQPVFGSPVKPAGKFEYMYCNVLPSKSYPITLKAK